MFKTFLILEKLSAGKIIYILVNKIKILLIETIQRSVSTDIHSYFINKKPVYKKLGLKEPKIKKHPGLRAIY